MTILDFLLRVDAWGRRPTVACPQVFAVSLATRASRPPSVLTRFRAPDAPAAEAWALAAAWGSPSVLVKRLRFRYDFGSEFIQQASAPVREELLQAAPGGLILDDNRSYASFDFKQ